MPNTLFSVLNGAQTINLNSEITQPETVEIIASGDLNKALKIKVIFTHFHKSHKPYNTIVISKSVFIFAYLI
jgi:acyl-CoA hydrolase